jgi:hypothetical protein
MDLLQRLFVFMDNDVRVARAVGKQKQFSNGEFNIISDATGRARKIAIVWLNPETLKESVVLQAREGEDGVSHYVGGEWETRLSQIISEVEQPKEQVAVSTATETPATPEDAPVVEANPVTLPAPTESNVTPVGLAVETGRITEEQANSSGVNQSEVVSPQGQKSFASRFLNSNSQNKGNDTNSQ